MFRGKRIVDCHLRQSKIRLGSPFLPDGDGEPRANAAAVFQPDPVRDTARKRAWVGLLPRWSTVNMRQVSKQPRKGSHSRLSPVSACGISSIQHGANKARAARLTSDTTIEVRSASPALSSCAFCRSPSPSVRGSVSSRLTSPSHVLQLSGIQSVMVPDQVASCLRFCSDIAVKIDDE